MIRSSASFIIPPDMNPDARPQAAVPESVQCPAERLRDYLLRPVTILRAFRREDIPFDLVAGMTVAAVAIPQAIAYASVAELPAHYGLYAAVVAAVVGSLWGCSRFLATGPVNASSLLVLPVLLSVAVPGTREYLVAASLVAVLAGVLRIILAMLKFGAVVTLASRPVLIGFTAGAAVHIAIGQLRHLLGIEVPAMPQLYRTVTTLARNLDSAHPASLALGASSLVLLVVLRRIGPRFPAALVSIALAALAVWILDLQEIGVRIVGEIPRSLPPPTWVSTGAFPDLEMVRGVIVGTLAVAALGLIEATAASRTLARRAHDRLNSNQEFFGQGMANIAAGLFSGYPVSGSFTRSALAYQAGARTHMTGVFTGLTILSGMLLLAPFAGFIPRSAIAGVLLVVAYGMLDREGLRQVIRTSKAETAIVAITFVSTMILPLDFAVLSGVVFSLAFFVIRSSLPRLVPVVPDPTYRHFVNDPSAPVCPQLGVLNIRGPLFFGAVYHLEEELRHNHEAHPGQNILVLRMHGVDICDLSGIEMLENTVQTYRDLGGDIFLIRPRRPVLEKMESSGFLDDTLGRDHLLEQEGAIEYLFDQVLDPAVCIYECEHRVFAECQALEKHSYGVEFPPAPKHPVLPGLHVSPEEFQRLASDDDALVIDLREPEEFRKGHVPGALLMPLRLIPKKGPELPRDRPLLFVCRSGRRTSRAFHILSDLGFEDMHGLQGGILAWKARGLPVAGPTGEEVHTFDPGDPATATEEADRERRVLSSMLRDTQTVELRERLDYLAGTRSIGYLKDALERSLARFGDSKPQPQAVVELDPDKAVLIVSDLHAQRRAFRKLLVDRYGTGATNLDSIVQGDLQVLLLGDILHSEDSSRWQAVEDEYVTRFASDDAEIGVTPAMDREMANGFGLAAMIMTLQEHFTGVHCLKGNHDNLLNVDESGNGAITKYVRWPGEGEISRAWTLVRLGAGFVGRYAAWENHLPLLAFHDNRDGLKFAASHSEPGRAYTLDEIRTRSDEVVFGLTWSRNQGVHAPDLLRNVFGKDWLRARYFVSHTGSDEGIVHVERNHLVMVNKPKHLVAAVVRPGVREFEIHIVSSG